MALKQQWGCFAVCHILLIILGVCASTVHSGNSGREFVFAPMPNLDKTGSIGVVLQAVSDKDTDINIFVRGISLDENITLLSVSRPYDYPLPINSLIYENVAGKIDSTVVITSDNDIFVLAYNLDKGNSDVFSVIPKQNLGQEYFIATMAREDNPHFGSGVISISASEQTTYLEFFLHSTVEFENVRFYAGDTIRYTLFPYETIQLLPHFINITGSRVLANASIAVSVGSKCAQVPAKVSACDHIAEQVAPFTSWGMAFVISPLAARTSGYVLQIVAGRNDTTVSYDNVAVKLNMGDYATVDIQDQEMMAVSADKPISIMQYSIGLGRDDVPNGDPSMMRVIPIEQYVTMATFPVYEYSSSFTIVKNNYLGVTSRCKYVENINVWMDGVLVTPIWIENNTIKVSDGTMYCLRWTAVYNGTYTLRSRRIVNETGHEISPTFSAVVYGTAPGESYLYRSASDDRTLNCMDSTLNTMSEERGCEDSPAPITTTETFSTGSSIPLTSCDQFTGIHIGLIASVAFLFVYAVAMTSIHIHLRRTITTTTKENAPDPYMDLQRRSQPDPKYQGMTFPSTLPMTTGSKTTGASPNSSQHDYVHMNQIVKPSEDEAEHVYVNNIK